MDRGAWRAAVYGAAENPTRLSDWAHTQTRALHAPLSMGFSRQEYWSGLSFPSPGHLPHPGIEPAPLAWQSDSWSLRHQGSPLLTYNTFITFVLIGGLFLGYSFTDLFIDSCTIFWNDFICKSILIFGKSSPSTSFSSFSIFLSYNNNDLKQIPVIISSSENNIWLKTKLSKILHIFEKQKEESLWH